VLYANAVFQMLYFDGRKTSKMVYFMLEFPDELFANNGFISDLQCARAAFAQSVLRFISPNR